MSTVLSAATLLVAITLMWAGWKKSTWSTPLAAVLSAFDLVGLVLLVVSLGWLGLGIFVGTNVAGFVGWGIQGAIYIDAQLSAAAALGGMQKASAREALATLASDTRLASLGPRVRVDLVRLLAERGRAAGEIEKMGPAVGLLYIIGEPRSLAWIVERFDAVLRLEGRSADDAMRTADTIVAAVEHSAMNLVEMVEALVVARGGATSEPPLETAQS